MPAKLLLPLRYLQPCFPVARFSTMRPVKTSRVLPVFSRVFPHKLKYQSFGSLKLASNGNDSKQQELKNQFSGNAIRKLSTRSGREIRASSSLIDDEAELSDWVSGLSSNSLKKTRLYSDSDKDDGGDESGSVRFGKGRSGREERGGKRRRESGFGEFDGSNRRGAARGSMERFPTRRSEDAAVNKSSRRESGFDDFNGLSRQRGARDSVERFPGRGRENGGGTVSSRQKGMDLNERYSGGSRGKGRFGGEAEGKRVGRDSGLRFGMDRDGSSRGKGRFGGEAEGRREKKRVGRDSGSRFGMDRDGSGEIRRGEKGERRGSLVMSVGDDVDEEEDEEEDKGFRSFKELIGSDEGSEEVDDDEDEDGEEEGEEGGDVLNGNSILARSVSEDAGRGSSPDSPGSSQSYLSETR